MFSVKMFSVKLKLNVHKCSRTDMYFYISLYSRIQRKRIKINSSPFCRQSDLPPAPAGVTLWCQATIPRPWCQRRVSTSHSCSVLTRSWQRAWHCDIMETITALEDMLHSVEERMLMLVEKPSTRVQACQVIVAPHWPMFLILCSHWSAAGQVQGVEGGGGGVPAPWPWGWVHRRGGREARYGAGEV